MNTPRTRPPDLDPAACSNGTFIANPAAHPGLVADCRALVNIRNHWTRQTVPTDSALLTWGTGDTTRITDWPGIRITHQRVTTLNLAFNQLTGPIPHQLNQLTNLKWLGLHDNQLTGPIPHQLSQLTNLTHLGLLNNQLTGPIPHQLNQLTNLEWLYLDGNQLTGPIPPELSQLTNLERLSLSYNQLTGPIPHQLNQLTNLTHLDLRGNQLTGPIPGPTQPTHQPNPPGPAR